jgi:hypothetical protein
MVESAEISTPKKRGVWQWFWRGSELQSARQAQQEVPAQARLALARARTAQELAERALEPIDALRAGPSLPLSVSLFREAAYWALVAQNDAPAPADLGAAFEQLPSEVLSFAAGGSEGLEQVRKALLLKSFRETAEDSPEQQRQDALALRAFVQALIDRQLGPERRIGRALVQRWVRLSVGALLLLALGITGVILIGNALRGPDLTEGKRWHPSSTNPGVPKAERHEYFFHTQEEDSPWVEYDLAKPTTFSVVEVYNRRDCCPERAAPAAIEVSNDETHWKEVSRRTDSFSVWEAKFAPTTARYVRVRVLRRSILHLAGLAVRAR